MTMTSRVSTPVRSIRPSIKQQPRHAPRALRTLVARVQSKQGTGQGQDNALSNVGSYLSEAAASIFSPMQNSNVPWPNEPMGYTGTYQYD